MLKQKLPQIEDIDIKQKLKMSVLGEIFGKDVVEKLIDESNMKE